MGQGMVTDRGNRARIAALVLSCASLAMAGPAAPALAQPMAGPPVYAETPAAALQRYIRTLATSPRDFTALIGAGRAALALGDTQAAGGFFGRADEVFPASPLPQAGMGAAAVADGDALSALAYFNRAQQLGATAMMIGADRGLAYDLLGRNAQAQADYRAALSGRDRDDARRRLALSLAITGDKPGALAMLGPLMARGDAGAARVRALVLALSGDTDGARRAMDASMPGSSARMDYFFRKLPGLSAVQKAAAVHLGIFPGAGQPVYAGAQPPASPSVSPGPSYTTALAIPTAPQARPAASAPTEAGRIGSIDDWLRSAPPPAATAVTEPVQTASVVPTRPDRIALPQRGAVQGPGLEKVWLQLASGTNAAALPDQFRRIKSRHKSLLEGISGFIAETADKARLLIGPFKSKSDAETFAEDLESESVDAFSWTSPAGVPVRKLPGE
jgi:Flp pilus assembly protein TadD